MRLFLSIICLLALSAVTENAKALAIGPVLTNTRSTGCNADAKIKSEKKRSALKPISRTSVKEAKAANHKAEMQERNSTNAVIFSDGVDNKRPVEHTPQRLDDENTDLEQPSSKDKQL